MLYHIKSNTSALAAYKLGHKRLILLSPKVLSVCVMECANTQLCCTASCVMMLFYLLSHISLN